MVFEFKMPDIGEGIHEGEIVEWLVSEGDQVDEDQDIVEVMTDKATVQISSPRAGTIQEIRFQEGDVVDVGDVFVVIHVDGEPAATDTETSETTETPEPPATEEDDVQAPAETVEATGSASSNGGPKRTPQGVLAPPSVRIEARKQGIDLTEVEGSGPGGRIQMADLEDHKKRPADRPRQAGGRLQAGGLVQGFDLRSIDRSDARSVELVQAPASSPRATAARAKGLQAHFSYVLSLPADRLVRAVEEAQELAAEHKVTIDDEAFIVKAVAQALTEHRRCNALIDEEAQELVIPGSVNLAVARHQADGLELVTVPSADSAGIIDIAQALDGDVDSDAQATASITTLGGLGGYASTPVLIHPQVTAVTVGALKDVARHEDGELVVGKELTLSFSFDHRYVDGYDGAVFAKAVARLLADPSGLLLGTR